MIRIKIDMLYRHIDSEKVKIEEDFYPLPQNFIIESVPVPSTYARAFNFRSALNERQSFLDTEVPDIEV